MNQTTILVSVSTVDPTALILIRDAINAGLLRIQNPGLIWDISIPNDESVEAQMTEIIQALETIADDMRGTAVEPSILKVRDQLEDAMMLLEE